MYYKKSLIIAIITSLVLGIYFSVATFVYDPLQVFHKPWGRKVTFNSNIREQALGIIKHYEFDSIILGNSLLENTSADEASKKIGGKFVNLSTSGLLYFERYTIASFALKNKDIKNVILVFDANFSPDKISSNAFIADAYTSNPLNQTKLYVNSKYAGCIAFMSRSSKCVGNATSLDMPNSWYGDIKHQRLFGGFENWLKYKTNIEELEALHDILKNGKEQVRIAKETLEKDKKIVDDYLIKLLEENPNTKFHIMVPPYSALFWEISNYYKMSLDDYEDILSHLISKTNKLENSEIYWFYNDSFFEDMAGYKDVSHFSPDINSKFIDAIANSTNKINSENKGLFFENLNSKMQNFDTKRYLDLMNENM